MLQVVYHAVQVSAKQGAAVNHTVTEIKAQKQNKTQRN